MSSNIGPALVIVTPIYEDLEASSRLFKELAAATGTNTYIVAVDDGSVRKPVDPAIIAAAGLRGVVIKLKRNVGHQLAIAIGLNYAANHFSDAASIVIMDSDGEDLPTSIAQLLTQLNSTDIDIVVAQRKSRVETLRFRAFYVVYKWLFKLLSGHKISFGNFMAMKPAAAKRLAAMQELSIHVAGCALKAKLRMTSCALDRGPRYAGHSKMNFVGLALHGFKALMVFAEDVLVRVGIACVLVAALSVVGVAAAITLKLLGFATPGWFSVALGILLLALLQTGALTLTTLMLSGVVRSGAATSISYDEFVDAVTDADTDSTH